MKKILIYVILKCNTACMYNVCAILSKMKNEENFIFIRARIEELLPQNCRSI